MNVKMLKLISHWSLIKTVKKEISEKTVKISLLQWEWNYRYLEKHHQSL